MGLSDTIRTMTNGYKSYIKLSRPLLTFPTWPSKKLCNIFFPFWFVSIFIFWDRSYLSESFDLNSIYFPKEKSENGPVIIIFPSITFSPCLCPVYNTKPNPLTHSLSHNPQVVKVLSFIIHAFGMGQNLHDSIVTFNIVGECQREKFDYLPLLLHYIHSLAESSRTFSTLDFFMQWENINTCT